MSAEAQPLQPGTWKGVVLPQEACNCNVALSSSLLPLPSNHCVPLPVYLVCGFNLDAVREVWSGDKLSTWRLLYPRNVLLLLRPENDKPGVGDGENSDSVPVSGF